MVKALAIAVGFVVAAMGHSKCQDVSANDTEASQKKCYKHVMWAKTTGIFKNKTYYENYLGAPYNLTGESSIADFQCVLYRKAENKGENQISGDGHDCMKPCTADPSFACPPGDDTPAAGTQGAGTKAGTVLKDDKSSKGGGMTTWAWVLIILGVCCGLPCLGVCCSAFLCYEAVAFILDPLCGGKKGAQKKKRALKKVADETNPVATGPVAMVSAVAPVATTSAPMSVYKTAPSLPNGLNAATSFVVAPTPFTASYAAPASMSYAAPVASMTYAAPAVTYAAPGAYAAQAVTYAAPMAASHPIAAEPVTAFDMIDTNHDGVIDRQELNAAIQ